MAKLVAVRGGKIVMRPVNSTMSTEIIAEAQALLDQQEVISGLTGEDAAVGNLMGNAGSTTTLKTRQRIAGDIPDQASLIGSALKATFAQTKVWAKNPDNLVTGAVTLDASDLVTSAVVKWPDGLPGVLTITSRDSNGAVLAYNITRVNGATTTTYTQPPITRNANGAATNVPDMVVT